MAATQMVKPTDPILPVHRIRARLVWAVCTGLLLASTLSQGGIYRWKDSHGVIHYSPSPPAAAAYQILKGPPPPPNGAGAADSPAGNDAGQSQASPGQPQQAQTDQAPKLTPEQSRQKCTYEQKRLASLEHRPQVLLQYPDGRVKRLSEEERQAEIANTKNRIDKYCGD